MTNLADKNQFIKIAEDLYDEVFFGALHRDTDNEDTNNVISRSVDIGDVVNVINKYDSHFGDNRYDINLVLDRTKAQYAKHCLKKLVYTNDINQLNISLEPDDFYTVEISNANDFKMQYQDAEDQYAKENKKRFFRKNEAEKTYSELYDEFHKHEDFLKSHVNAHFDIKFYYRKSLYTAFSNYIDKYNSIKGSTSLTFKELWDYSQFLRWAEKVVFYDNSISNYIFSDSKMDTKTSRLFSVQKDNLMIIFELSQVKDDFRRNQTIDEIKIEVKEEFGKHLVSHFDVIDGDCYYSDDSDLYLMNTINMCLINAVTKSFKDIISRIIRKSFINI